jgi:hypothetical protein
MTLAPVGDPAAAAASEVQRSQSHCPQFQASSDRRSAVVHLEGEGERHMRDEEDKTHLYHLAMYVWEWVLWAWLLSAIS